MILHYETLAHCAVLVKSFLCGQGFNNIIASATLLVAIRQLRSGGKVGQGESADSSVDVSASEEADSALIAQAETAATALAKRMQSVPDAEMTASELLTELATEPDGAVLFLDALAENGR